MSKQISPRAIGAAYDTITHLWTRKEFNQDNGIEQHRRALAFAQKEGLALDVGCGCTGRFFSLMRDNGLAPEGLDVSPQMLNIAREKFPDISFYHADICVWESDQRYAFISAWDSIWHVPLAQQSAVLHKLCHYLAQDGVLIFSFGGVDEAGEHTNAEMGPEVYYASLGVSGVLDVIAGAGCVCRHLEYDQYPELHTYMIVQKTTQPDACA